MATRRSILAGRRVSISSQARKGSRVEGLEEIQENLARVIDSTTGRHAKNVYVKAALYGKTVIRGQIYARGLHVTGNLDHGVYAANGDDNKPNALLGMNYRIAPHAHIVEFGTVLRHLKSGKSTGIMPAQPYFRPGITLASPGMGAITKEGLAEVIENAPKK